VIARSSRLLVFAVLVVCLSSTIASATAAPAGKPRVTFIGDSISESLDYTLSARKILRKRFSVRFDLETCRRLVAPSCAFNGSTPLTALQAVQAYGSGIGDVLIVSVGYNEGSAGYGRGIDQVMRAARRAGARGVVWLTLREAGNYSAIYHSTNGAIRKAAKRWPPLVLADWNAHSTGKTWFRGDELHLTVTGAEALARFLRPYVLQAARS
jgi:hypothetical protein